MREYEHRPNISTARRDSPSTSKRNSIRLRIQLTPMIKFYASVNADSKLDNLKNVIDDILKQTYSVMLPRYTLRSEDGFELLETFTVGDILDDNQLILIDQYSHLLMNTENKASDIAVKNSVETKPAVKNTFEKNETQKIKSTLKNEAQKTNPVMPKKSRIILPNESPVEIDMIPVKENFSITDNSMDNLTTNSTNNITTSQKEEPVASLLNNADDKPKNKTTKNIGKYIQETSPVPKPDNFKGFVVKKSDFDKVSGTKIEESSFKPLKKRKVGEEVDFDF